MIRLRQAHVAIALAVAQATADESGQVR